MITVVGGVYRESCMQPERDDYVGSGGRAAFVITQLGASVKLYSYADQTVKMVIDVFNSHNAKKIRFYPTSVPNSIWFKYHHSLAAPAISGLSTLHPPIKVKASKVIRYGLIEGDAIVDADYAVYDPQNPNPVPFGANGSKAKHLALVLNEHEAAKLVNQLIPDARDAAEKLIAASIAEVVIVKMGPKGVLVADAKSIEMVSPYQTDNVWKVGSGDTFVATFGYFWMQRKYTPVDAAVLASKATAFYVSTLGYASRQRLMSYNPPAVMFSARYLEGHQPNVYLAGPFFTLAQLWLIDEAKKNLKEMGMKVFSPIHEVGRGSAQDVVHKDIKGIEECDVMFAIGDGIDSGTMYEIGYARALGKPVIVYVENETPESMKMMEGSECYICHDYATAIYQTVWVAVGQ